LTGWMVGAQPFAARRHRRSSVGRPIPAARAAPSRRPRLVRGPRLGVSLDAKVVSFAIRDLGFADRRPPT
jgi:hypothetical protein